VDLRGRHHLGDELVVNDELHHAVSAIVDADRERTRMLVERGQQDRVHQLDDGRLAYSAQVDVLETPRSLAHGPGYHSRSARSLAPIRAAAA
jgi:hypothetical protein